MTPARNRLALGLAAATVALGALVLSGTDTVPVASQSTDVGYDIDCEPKPNGGLRCRADRGPRATTTTSSIAPATTSPIPETTSPTTDAPPTSTSSTTTTTQPATTTTAATNPASEFEQLRTRIAWQSSTAAHEVSPIPGINLAFDWSRVGRPRVWPPYSGRAGHNVWGQIMRVSGGTNVSLQTSQPWILHVKDGEWVRATGTGCSTQAKMDGSHYTLAGFASVGNRPTIGYDAATGISTAPLAYLTNPVWWHWWYAGDWPRCPFEPDRGPVGMLVWARLVGPDAASARYQVAFAGDTHQTLESGAPSGDVGIPAHVVLPNAAPGEQAGPWVLLGYLSTTVAQIEAATFPIPPKPAG
jgi:hypothetical protein